MKGMVSTNAQECSMLPKNRNMHMHVDACVHAKTHTITWQTYIYIKKYIKKASIVLQMGQHSWHIKNTVLSARSKLKTAAGRLGWDLWAVLSGNPGMILSKVQTCIKENSRQILYSLSSLTYLFPRNKHKGILEKSGSSRTWMWESVQVNRGTENLLVRLAWLICGGWGWGGVEILGSISSVSKYSWKTRG